MNYFSKKTYLKDNNDNFNASNINNLENSSNINGIKDASKKTCGGNPI